MFHTEARRHEGTKMNALCDSVVALVASVPLCEIIISGNTANRGGGLYQAGGNAILTNTTFDNNYARPNFGKALVKAKNAKLTVNGESDPNDVALNLYLDESDF